MGESSGYMITVNGSQYLLECGAPVFPSLGFDGLERIKGIFATHSHEDHRRWYTDVVLFHFYDTKVSHRVRLISSETVLEEYHKNSKGALERSLSPDSKRIIDIPYEMMVEEVLIGPRSKYFINQEWEGDGRYCYRVMDRSGRVIGPEKAKIFINPRANRPRMLYKDDETGEWIEPESFYPFRSSVFYEENKNIFRDEEADLTVEAFKSSVWHGIPNVGYRFRTPGNSLLFSSDTVYKPSLWEELYQTRRPQRFETIRREEFEERAVIVGDINDFIERTWSHQRYEAAVSAYRDSVVVHDVARKNSVVHTDYKDIADSEIPQLIFTHSPDNLTARHPILRSGKRLVLRHNRLYESAKGRLYPFDADVYIRHFSRYLVGYQSTQRTHKLIEKDGLLGVVETDQPGEAILWLELYEDLGGEYYPVLSAPNKYYAARPDGKVEEITLGPRSTRGRVVKNRRGRIMKSARKP